MYCAQYPSPRLLIFQISSTCKAQLNRGARSESYSSCTSQRRATKTTQQMDLFHAAYDKTPFHKVMTICYIAHTEARDEKNIPVYSRPLVPCRMQGHRQQ